MRLSLLRDLVQSLEVSRFAKENPSEALITEAAAQLRRDGRVKIHFPKFIHRNWS